MAGIGRSSCDRAGLFARSADINERAFFVF
jgi:hypothetical protein